MKNNQSLPIAILCVIGLVMLRFALLEYSNFAPIAAAGMFAMYFIRNKKIAFGLPLTALFLSDLFIQIQTGYGLYFERLIDYGAIAVSLIVAYYIFQTKKNFFTGLGATIIGSIIFFILSNFGVWATGTMYPHTINGLLTAYEMGIPFYRGTIAGDVLFFTVFFLGYQAIVSTLPKYQPA